MAWQVAVQDLVAAVREWDTINNDKGWFREAQDELVAHYQAQITLRVLVQASDLHGVRYRNGLTKRYSTPLARLLVYLRTVSASKNHRDSRHSSNRRRIVPVPSTPILTLTLTPIPIGQSTFSGEAPRPPLFEAHLELNLVEDDTAFGEIQLRPSLAEVQQGINEPAKSMVKNTQCVLNWGVDREGDPKSFTSMYTRLAADKQICKQVPYSPRGWVS